MNSDDQGSPGLPAAPAPPKQHWSFPQPIAWMVLAISLAATGGGWFIARQHEDLTARKHFDEEASRIATAVVERMTIYQDVLHGAVGLFAASQSVERSEWKAYVESVSIEKRFPGVDGLGYVAYVPHEKLEDFLEITRKDKTPDFRLRNSGTNADLFIVKYLEPEGQYRELLGLDFGTYPERRALAERARDTGEATLSGSMNLVDATRVWQAGLMMLLPVYRHGAATTTESERRAGIEGWVYARFLTAQLMRGMFGATVPTLHFQVLDGPEPGRGKLIYDNDPELPNQHPGYQPQCASVIELPLGGRSWHLCFTTKPAFDRTISRWPEIVAGGGGGLVSLLLFGIAWSLGSTRERALRMAAGMTTALREANEKLQREITERQHAERRTAMQYAVTRALAEATTLPEVAPKILQAICESLGWDVGALWQLEPQAGELRCVEVWHRPQLESVAFEAATRQRIFAVGEGLPGRVWADKKPAWIADVLEDRNFPRAEFAAQVGLHGAFGFPVLMGEEFLGVIEFFSHEILEPDAELIEQMAASGSQVGQFIERKHSEAAQKNSEVLYHSLVESLPLQILRKDLSGRILFANQRFCGGAGKIRADIEGKSDLDLFPPTLAARHREVEARVIASGLPVETVEEHPGPNGQPRFVQVITAPVCDGAGQVTGLLGIFSDITDKHHAEEALEHERFLLRTLMDNLPDRIYFKDRESRFLRNSRAHLERFGLTQARQAIGKTDFDFFSDEHARQAYADEQELMETGRTVTKEEKEVWPDGSVSWALSTKLPLRDESGRTIGTFGISHDITARKNVEEALRVAKDAAEEASRTKSQFLASMSHELRTPLNSVIGFSNILLKNKSRNLTAAELTFLDRIAANGKHLLSLINEILDLSKIEARKIELQIAPVALDELVGETVAQQEGLVRDKPVQLLAALPANVAPFPTDADKLRQIIINLIGNALKFTERGSVTVRVVTDPDDHHPLRIDVTDTGIGIPQDKLALIFEAFQQAEAGTARKYGGTGLGLTISQALCRLMGYHITVSSEVGRGSTFSIQLAPTPEVATGIPVVMLPVQPTVRPVKTESALPGRRVLVIDDEPDSRILLAHMIAECGCQVLSASSGAQGLQMAREYRPDLITLDLMMPSMDGWQVVRAFKADLELSHIPVVIVSVVAAENRGHIFGAVDVLQKPVARQELLDVLQRILPRAQPRVLVVDDDPDVHQMIAAQLQGEVAEIRFAFNGRDALALLEQFTPDLVLLDLMMPVMNGMGFFNALRHDPRFQQLPVVVMTAKELTAAETGQLKMEALRVLNKAEVFAGELKRVLEELLPGRTTRAPEKNQ